MSAPSSSLISRVHIYRKGPEFQKLFRYAMASVITTFFALGLLGLFYGVLKIGSATMSNVYATAITTVPSYYLNRKWAWGKSGKSHLTKEVIPFWVIAIISAVISTVVVHFADQEARLHTHFGHGMLTVVVELANFTTYAVLWVAKYVYFNKVLFKHQHHLGDAEATASSTSSAAAI
jgi:putative flippase GtrA